MQIDGIDINRSIAQVEALLESDKECSASLKAAVTLLIVVVKLLVNRLGLNSRNSSKPPASDPNRERTSQSKKQRKPGGQAGSLGATLALVEDPDEIEEVLLDRQQLPAGNYRSAGYERRQVFDIRIRRYVTEYRSEILINEQGKRFCAGFPDNLTGKAQYSQSVKAQACYLSQYQLIPYDRLQCQFADQFGFSVSAGSLFNFNLEAFKRLEAFELLAKSMLTQAHLLHADETGVNLAGKRQWLHTASNEQWTLLALHAKRGHQAMSEIGILPAFKGVMIHDHWSPYFTYKDCAHALCHAHLQRELQCLIEQDTLGWAESMKTLLLNANQAVKQAGGVLDDQTAFHYEQQYDQVIEQAKIESPEPVRPPGKKGRLKKSKARNLLERFIGFKKEILRFMTEPIVPFTNNLGERDLRMTKVHQKISGCFRSVEGANTFCRIRSYLLTCQKQGTNAFEALQLLFNGQWPDFMKQKILDYEKQLAGAE